jgi:hypothetical protein
MSKHVSRAARWSRHGPNEQRAAYGRVYFRAGSWHAVVTYQLPAPPGEPPPAPQTWDVANFKRARNAMIAVEDKARELERRHGAGLVFMPHA